MPHNKMPNKPAIQMYIELLCLWLTKCSGFVKRFQHRIKAVIHSVKYKDILSLLNFISTGSMNTFLRPK